FTLVFTSLAHFIVKIVSLQEEIQGGLHPSPQTQRPMFQSHRRGGNPHYDYLIRRMQLTDLSGMSVDQAATTYASFFNCGDLASKPFFSNPYVQDLLKIGTAPAISAQTIAQSSSPSPAATSSSTGAFWSSMPESSEPATDMCSNPTCTTAVNVFDFRCFKCRNRFCAACKGDKITCPSCS
ncbi:MAG: hypothetical protein VX778_03910, partial [Candidatus Thermoplasmatota archaeon]|nr:hypothetical protein [Candidatus Thermoplasmatota archaeon]